MYGMARGENHFQDHLAKAKGFVLKGIYGINLKTDAYVFALAQNSRQLSLKKQII